LTGEPCVRWAAHRERHAEDRLAGLEQRRVDGLVGLEPECGCTFAQGAPNSFFARSMAIVSAMSTLLAAAVIALAGIALGVLVGELAALREEAPGG